MNRRTLTLAATALLMGSLVPGADAKPAARPAAKRPAARPASNASSNAALTAAFNNYLNRLRAKLDKNWYVADGKNHVTLTATMAADGSVTNVSLCSSPTDTKAEQAASDAFNQSQPLDPLPTNVQSLKLVLTFDSSADPHGDSSRSIGAKVEQVVLAGQQPPK